MNKSDADKIITGYVKKLFGFAVSKVRNYCDAEELAQEIVFQVYRSLLLRDNIINLDGYIYRVSQNVFARYVDGKCRYRAVDGLESMPDENDAFRELEKEESCGILRREITYLSEIQRKIAVHYYFRDLKIREIASRLSLSENTVKWHLACLRKELRTGMEKTRTTGALGAQPITLTNMGHNGHPGEYGDTANFLAKAITQNVAYAAYHQPRTISGIAEELGVNPIFIEDEVAVLEAYGYMDKLSNGKFRTNIHITEPSEESYKIYRAIEKKYPPLFAENFFAPVLNGITEIPEFMQVPDNDLNLFKWSLVCFLANKLATAEITDAKFSVKRPDGGDFVATAQVAVKPTWDISDAEDCKLYSAVGDMWRNNETDSMWWKSWQLNTYWTKRELSWRDNRETDFGNLFYFLNGTLPESESTVESYQRLLDKGYLLKKDGKYKVNIILSDSEQKWWSYIPSAPDEITELSKEYAREATKAELIGQPEHMHEQIRYYKQNAACSLHTRIMKQLVDMGVLKVPTDEQRMGLLTIMFTGK